MLEGKTADVYLVALDRCCPHSSAEETEEGKNGMSRSWSPPATRPRHDPNLTLPHAVMPCSLLPFLPAQPLLFSCSRNLTLVLTVGNSASYFHFKDQMGKGHV